MKISLRKANALQLLINEQINEPFGDGVTIGKFDNPEEVISNATQLLQTKIETKFSLIEVLFKLRKKAGAKSAEVGIAGLLTDLAENEKETAFVKQLASTKQTAPKLEVVLASLDEIKKEQTTNQYQRRDSINVALMNKETVESYAKSLILLRKAKQALSDKLLHLNISTEIELDEKEVKVLTDYNIL